MHVESLIVPGIVFSFVLRDVLDLEAIFSPFPGQQMKKSNVSNRKRHFIHIIMSIYKTYEIGNTKHPGPCDFN